MIAELEALRLSVDRVLDELKRAPSGPPEPMELGEFDLAQSSMLGDMKDWLNREGIDPKLIDEVAERLMRDGGQIG